MSVFSPVVTVSQTVSRMVSKHAKTCAFAGAVVLAGASEAFAEDNASAVTLPDTGLDIGAYLSAGIVAMGSIVAVAVGGYCAFLLIRKGIRWAGKALG